MSKIRLWWVGISQISGIGIIGLGYWLKMMEFFLCVFGMVMIIEGLPYFAFPKRMKFWIQKISTTPEGALRKFGLVLMTLGLLLVYFGRR